MGTYVKLAAAEGLRASRKDIYECDKKVKRFFRSSKIVGSGKESTAVSHVSFSSVNNLVSICAGTKVIFYNYITEQVAYTYSDTKEFVRCCSFRSDGKVAAVSNDAGWIQLVALELKTNLRRWRAHEAPCHAHQFSSNKTRLMTGGDDGIAKYWDTVTGEVVQEFKFHSDKIRTLSDFCGSENMWVTGGYDTVGYLFDIRDHSKPMAKVEHGASIEFIELSSANNILLTVGGNTLKLWDLSNGLKLMHTFEPHQRTIVRGYIRDAILTASLDGTVRYFNHAAISNGEYVSVDEKFSSSLNEAEQSNEEESDADDSSASVKSKTNPDNEGDFNTPVDPGLCSAMTENSQKSQESLINKVESGKTPTRQDEAEEFLTPENDALSPSESVQPLHEKLASLPVDKLNNTSVNFETARSCIVSPKRVRKLKEANSVEEEATGDRSVSLRHVYRFGESVTAFTVSTDAKSIAVGLANGGWIIRHNDKSIVPQEPKSKKAFKIVENILEYKTVKLTLLDRLVKTFQYQAAMDLALSLSPDHVYNLVETLILRGSLATAVRGKDEQTIVPLLRFLSGHMGSDIHNTSSLLEMAHAVLDNNEWLQYCDNDSVIQELRKIPNKINFELFQHNILQSLKGSLDLILSRQGNAEDMP